MRNLLLCTLLVGCATTNTNHIGNPLLLPVGAVRTGVENGFYNARRKQVKSYIITNRDALLRDISTGTGDTLDGLYKVAKIPAKNQAALAQELLRGQEQYFGKNPEPMVVAVMVHS